MTTSVKNPTEGVLSEVKKANNYERPKRKGFDFGTAECVYKVSQIQAVVLLLEYSVRRPAGNGLPHCRIYWFALV